MNTFNYAEAIEKLNFATKAYDEGHPILSDIEWDNLYFDVVRWENENNIYDKNSPTQKINYEVVNALTKVTHNHPMLSLDKTKDWNEFVNYFNTTNRFKDIIGMIKLDGLTCSLKYIDGNLVSAETRGNGEVGEDILHNARVIKNIPKRINYRDELILDGEVICTYDNFENFATEYKNPRNFAAGSIRLLDASECARRNLTFVVWNVVTPITNSVIDNFNIIQKLGFTVTPWTSSFDFDAKDFLQDQAKRLGYPIDGLVGRFDDVDYGTRLGSTGHHSRAAYAFKFYDEEYETTVKYIDWTMGRTGILTPVAVFEPIDIDGSTVERASMHNLSIFKASNLKYQGQRISVFKANQIIPQIAEVFPYDAETASVSGMDIPSICPICGQPTDVELSAGDIENLICSNPNCEGKLINRLDHYCGKKGMDIKGLSKATLEKLVDWGWINSILDLYNLSIHSKEWMNRPGFGEKSVTKILDAIEESKNCELWKFISAIGIPLIGIVNAKELANQYKTWKTFRQVVEGQGSSNILNIYGFGYEMYQSIIMFNYSEADKISNLLNFNAIEKDIITNEKTLEGKIICITGKLNIYKNRDALKADIEAHGGKVTGSVSGKTHYLINNDINSTSSKNTDAKKFNIPIMTEQDFISKFF